MATQNRWITLGAVFLFIGLILSGYLTSHHYDLLYGMSGTKSVCNVSSTLDCDAVNTSNYSELFGIPVALIAFMAFLVQLLLLLGIRAFDEEEKRKLARYYYYLTLGNVIYSAFLAIVSTFLLKIYCLFCIGLYIVAGVSFLCGYKLTRLTGAKKYFAQDLRSLFKSADAGGARGVLFVLFIIPIGSVLAHGMLTQGIKDLTPMINQSLADWKSNTQYNFSITNAPEMGNSSAPMQIVEFADFQCGHCKRAAPSIHAFTNAHKNDVRFIFQNYPLDPSCNPNMKGAGGHSLSCSFAKASLCAHRQNKFFAAHDWIYERQETLNAQMIDTMADDLKLDKNQYKTCLEDPSVMNELASQIERARLAGLEGTPTVFVNGRLLPAGFMIPVLEAALKDIKK
ncbi:MAG: vitamin K epoxide reductase family protein [Oligoflexia bacterium]|nr:vitamin K epoxide reductase family protein [Oligoflexia bacterium]